MADIAGVDVDLCMVCEVARPVLDDSGGVLVLVF